MDDTGTQTERQTDIYITGAAGGTRGPGWPPRLPLRPPTSQVILRLTHGIGSETDMISRPCYHRGTSKKLNHSVMNKQKTTTDRKTMAN